MRRSPDPIVTASRDRTTIRGNLSLAFKLLKKGDSASRSKAHETLSDYIDDTLMRLEFIKVRNEAYQQQIEEVCSEILSSAERWTTSGWLDEEMSRQARKDIDRITSRIHREAVLYKYWDGDLQTYKDLLERRREGRLTSIELSELFSSFGKRMRDLGLEEREVSLVIERLKPEFHEKTKGFFEHQIGPTIDLIATALRAFDDATRLRGAAVGHFVAIPTYSRKDTSSFPTAESFLRHFYEGRLGLDGDLTQAELGKIDSRLLAALDEEFKGKRRAELHRLLPTTKQRKDAQLLARYGYVPQGEDRRKKLTVLARDHPKPA